METNVKSRRLNRALQQRIGDMAALKKRLRHEILQRRALEKTLKQTQRHHDQLLKKSHLMHEQLRHLSRKILLAQEEERKKISRELHDHIGQTLSGINVHLEALSKEAKTRTPHLRKKIKRTQQLVARSVEIVHRFARELRPALLDDLGLIPALHSLIKDFNRRTGLRVGFAAFPGVEQMSGMKRTVLYRVAQEALVNVALHAQATHVRVSIRKVRGAVRMEIKDDGGSFQAEPKLSAKRRDRLGLVGMRERVEMVGGAFAVQAAPGRGTTILARIPLGKGARI